jgi:hypothetical protein
MAVPRSLPAQHEASASANMALSPAVHDGTQDACASTSAGEIRHALSHRAKHSSRGEIDDQTNQLDSSVSRRDRTRRRRRGRGCAAIVDVRQHESVVAFVERELHTVEQFSTAVSVLDIDRWYEWRLQQRRERHGKRHV